MTARIAPLTPATAPDAARPIFEQIQKGLGMVPALFATMAASPPSLGAFLAWDAAVQTPGGLTKKEIEKIYLHVSELNGCGYCLSAHTVIGGKFGLSTTEIDDARSGRGASPREDALLGLARRVVRAGGHGAGGDLVRAREAGVSDRDVIDVIASVAHMTFTNAVAIVAGTDIDFPKAPRLPGA